MLFLWECHLEAIWLRRWAGTGSSEWRSLHLCSWTLGTWGAAHPCWLFYKLYSIICRPKSNIATGSCYQPALRWRYSQSDSWWCILWGGRCSWCSETSWQQIWSWNRKVNRCPCRWGCRIEGSWTRRILLWASMATRYESQLSRFSLVGYCRYWYCISLSSLASSWLLRDQLPVHHRISAQLSLSPWL